MQPVLNFNKNFSSWESDPRAVRSQDNTLLSQVSQVKWTKCIEMPTSTIWCKHWKSKRPASQNEDVSYSYVVSTEFMAPCFLLWKFVEYKTTSQNEADVWPERKVPEILKSYRHWMQ